MYEQTIDVMFKISQLIQDKIPDFNDISELSVADSIYVVDSERIFWYNGEEVVEMTPNELDGGLRQEFFRDYVEV